MREEHQGNEEQAVILRLPLVGGDFGSESERHGIRALEKMLEREIEATHTGELDGDEFGGAVARIYLYGPSADRLFETILPVFRSSGLAPGAHIVKRYGGPGAVETSISF